MGKIFGISDLPVSTITTPFENIMPRPQVRKLSQAERRLLKVTPKDSTQKLSNIKKSKMFIKMRNGFGKLMKHFSKSNNIA